MKNNAFSNGKQECEEHGAVKGCCVHDRAGRIVWIAEADHLRLGTDEGLELVQVRAPVCGSVIREELPRLHLCTHSTQHSPELHVIRDLHHDLIARLDHRPSRDEVRLSAAIGGLDVVLLGTLIEGCDSLPERRSPV